MKNKIFLKNTFENNVILFLNKIIEKKTKQILENNIAEIEILEKAINIIKSYCLFENTKYISVEKKLPEIDKEILFETDRIKTYYCDQTNPEIIRNMWRTNSELMEPMDIIIDDGLHEFEANVCFFENSIHKLKRNGIYIIEDIYVATVPRWNEKFKEYSTKYPDLCFQYIQIPSTVNNYDNGIILIQYRHM